MQTDAVPACGKRLTNRGLGFPGARGSVTYISKIGSERVDVGIGEFGETVVDDGGHRPGSGPV